MGRVYMGSTIWVLKEGQEQNDWDHSQILIEERNLNKLAKEFNLITLNDLLDYSVLNEEYGMPVDEINYYEALELRAIIESYISSISSNTKIKFKKLSELNMEFEDILLKINQAHQENKKLRLTVMQ